jgi:hypothetical protein
MHKSASPIFAWTTLAFGNFLIYVNPVQAQNSQTFYSNKTGAQYGYSLKGLIEIGHRKKSVHWRLGLSGGIGAFLGNEWLYPSLNTDLMLYRGGIGSKYPGSNVGSGIEFEWIISYTFTAGFENRMRANHRIQPGIRNYPLYYFNTFTYPSLQNPYNYSFSYGGNVVIFFTKKKDRVKRIGYLGIHVDRLQIGYINDGPPFGPPFGDKFDRYHTGGGFLTFHGNNNWPVNLLEVGFNKYTGYSRNAYELANKLGTGYVYYRDIEQQYYNKSRFYLNIGNTYRQWGASFSLYNHPRFDVQHTIHLNSFYPLHMVPYKWGITAAPVFYHTFTKIGLQ